ncbi:hypothetical protein FHU13_002047 [Methylobacterium sp. R2-1]|nr:hypothetical protein [Methylobacterium sp. R2-1]
MSLTNCAEKVSNRKVQPILFGLLSDGSGEVRFACLRSAAFESGPASRESSRFSPSSDWYGRWAVQPLHGTLMQKARRVERSVCPDDIVVLGSTRRTGQS